MNKNTCLGWVLEEVAKCSDCRGIKEINESKLASKCLLKFTYEAHGEKGVTTELEEVVVATNPINAKKFTHNSSDFLFCGILWHLLHGGLQLWVRQSREVDLAVGGKG